MRSFVFGTLMIAAVAGCGGAVAPAPEADQKAQQQKMEDAMRQHYEAKMKAQKNGSAS